MADPDGILGRITIYPVKSLDGIDVDEALVQDGGSLAGDRRWRLVDLDGRVVNAKRTPRLHGVRAAFDLDARRVRLEVDEAADLPPRCRATAAEFPLVPGEAGPCAWLSAVLAMPVLLEERVEGGFPDDRDAPGATVAAAATLDAVAEWFRLPHTEVRRRFRVNLEVVGPAPFWEDALACPAAADASGTLADRPPAEPRRFAVGGQTWLATGVCRRSPVPTRDSASGRDDALFRAVFESRRRVSLRGDVDAASWGHLYRLAINTRGLSGPGPIRRGDAVCVLP